MSHPPRVPPSFCRRAKPPPGLVMYVVYCKPLDYPSGYVVRLWTVTPTGCAFNPDPLCLADNLETARAAIPDEFVCLARHPDDDPCIVETWI